MARMQKAVSTPSHAIIFRTHFWDDFAQRQLDRLVARSGTGHVYVLVDETNGRVDGIRHDRIVRVTETDLFAMGLPRAGTGNLFWFNGDYPLYYFLEQAENYDYYIQLEYDVVVNTQLDDLVARAAADRVDFLGLTKGEPVQEWAWLHTCRGFYDPAAIRYKLICFCLFSHRALQVLLRRRLELASRMAADPEAGWPFCEGFIATEMDAMGFNSPELSRYLDTTAYDTWPPYVESDLPVLREQPVIHPLLDQDRYVSSLLKYKVGLIGYINPYSLLHKKLRRLPVGNYLQALTGSFLQKAARTLRLRQLPSA